MGLTQHFIKSVIIFEFSIIALIMMLTVLLKIFNYYSVRYNVRKKAKIEWYLVDAAKHHKKFNNRDFPGKLKNLNLLLNVIDKLDNNKLDKYWLEIRENFINVVMLPLAKRATSSRKWQERYYAARTFSLIREKEDHLFI